MIEDLYTADGRPGRQDDGKVPGQGHAAHGHLRPRLRPVPHRGRPEPLARGERLPGCSTTAGGGEEHLAGVDWSRTRAFAIGLAGIFINVKDKYDQGIVDPGDEADRLRERDRRAARGADRSGDRRERRQAGLHRRQVLPRPLQGQRARPDRRLPARLSRLVGGGDRQDDRGRLPPQYQGLERRPLRRPVARARDPVLQPPDRQREPASDRHRPDRAQHVRRGRPRLHGRQGARPWAPPQESPLPARRAPWPRLFDD